MLQLQLHDFMLHHLPLWSCIPTFQTITQIGGTVATIETYWKAILKPAVVASILCLLAAGMGWGVDDILLLYATCVATAGSAFAWLLHFATRREWMLYLLHANVVSHELLAKTRWRSQTGLLRVVVCRDVPSVAIGINRTWLNSLTNEDTIYKGKITRHKSCSIANTKVGNLNSYYHSVFLNSIQNVINTLIIFCHLDESWPSNSKGAADLCWSPERLRPVWAPVKQTPGAAAVSIHGDCLEHPLETLFFFWLLDPETPLRKGLDRLDYVE